MELHQIQLHISTVANNKEELIKLDNQLSHLKKIIFSKESIIEEKTQSIKHLQLEEEIANERVTFLEKKCAERM